MDIVRLVGTAFRYYTESEIGKRFDVSQSTINGWRHGQKKPSYESAVKEREFHHHLIRRILKQKTYSVEERAFLLDSAAGLRAEASRMNSTCDTIMIELARRSAT